MPRVPEGKVLTRKDSGPRTLKEAATYGHKDFREFIELLNHHNVLYSVVGGCSVAYQGFPRYTGNQKSGIWAYIMSFKSISLDFNDLIKNKKATNRLQDKRDIQELGKIKGNYPPSRSRTNMKVLVGF